jgi:hypothetical protein
MWSWGGNPHRRNSSTRLVVNSCIPVRCSSNNARLSCGADAGPLPLLAVLSISDFRRDGAIRPIGTHTGALSHWCELRECPLFLRNNRVRLDMIFRSWRSPVKGRLHARFLVEFLRSSRRPSEQIPIAIEYSGFLFAGKYLAFFLALEAVTSLHFTLNLGGNSHGSKN